MQRGFWHEQYREKAKSDDPVVASGRGVETDLTHLLHLIRRAVDMLQLSGHDELLDLGCGNGLFEIVLSGLCKRVAAVELVDELARHARRNNTHYRNVEIHCASAAETGLPDAGFDKIVSVGMMQLIEDASTQRKVFMEISRLLRAGGVAWVADLPDLAKKTAFLEPYLAGVRSATHLSEAQKNAIIERNNHTAWYDRQEVSAMAQCAGLNAIAMDQPPALGKESIRFDVLLRKPATDARGDRLP